jgi:hypothetical protein
MRYILGLTFWWLLLWSQLWCLSIKLGALAQPERTSGGAVYAGRLITLVLAEAQTRSRR